MEVYVCMTRKNNPIPASAGPLGPEKLVLIWVRGNLEQQNRDGKVMSVKENGKIIIFETWKQTNQHFNGNNLNISTKLKW